MTSILRSAIAGLALVASAGVAAAASTVGSATPEHMSLTAAQQHEIWQDVSKQAVKATPPAGFKATIGEALPSSIKLQPLPASVSKDVPSVKSDEYAMLQDQVLIVDPSSKKIVDIVMP